MSYVVDGLIEASDLNTFRLQAKEIINDSNAGGTTEATGGKGYGEPIITVAVAVDDDVAAGLGLEDLLEWGRIFQDVNQAIKHQTNVEPFPFQFVVRDDLIAAVPALITELGNMSTNRFTVNAANVTTVAGALTSDRLGEPWEGTIAHQYIVNATNWNDLRYFFNSGGKITSTPSYTAVGDPVGSVDKAWALLMAGIGDIVFDYTTTTANGGAPGTPVSLGFYDLTSSDQLIWSKTGAGAYGSESVKINAKLNGAPGSASGIIFTLEFDSDANDNAVVPGDAHSSTGYLIGNGIYPILPPDFITLVELGEAGVAPLVGTISTPQPTQSCDIGINCPNEFVITAGASPVYGTLSYAWSLSRRLSDFEIISGLNTNQLTVRAGDGPAPETDSLTAQCIITDNGRNTGSDTVTVSVVITSTASITYQLSDRHRMGGNATTSAQFSMGIGPAAPNRVIIVAQVVRDYASAKTQSLRCETSSEWGSEIMPKGTAYCGGNLLGWHASYQLYTLPILSASAATIATFYGKGYIEYGRMFYCYTFYTDKNVTPAKTKWQTYGTGQAVVTRNAVTETNQVGPNQDTYVLGFTTAVGAPTQMRVWSPNPNPYTGRHLSEEGSDLEWATSHSYMLGSEMPTYISTWPINASANINQNSIGVATVVFE